MYVFVKNVNTIKVQQKNTLKRSNLVRCAWINGTQNLTRVGNVTLGCVNIKHAPDKQSVTYSAKKPRNGCKKAKKAETILC